MKAIQLKTFFIIKRDLWLDWIRTRPLIHEEQGYFLVHAGVHPSWCLPEARKVAYEVQEALRVPYLFRVFSKMEEEILQKWEEGIVRKRGFQQPSIL